MTQITLVSLYAQPYLQETIKLSQKQDPNLAKLKEQAKERKSRDLQMMKVLYG